MKLYKSALLMFTGLFAATAFVAAGEPTLKQVTFGPSNHFFGYIGHVGNTPWNASGRYMVLLRTPLLDQMPEPEDTADIVLLDTQNNYAVEKIEESRAWNPQQGTMLYWNPDKPETQFFFNDRDPETQHVFCVLYDVETRSRIREYRFDDTPIGNSGVAQQGGYFLGLNYGRMDKLRKVTGYADAYDWTEGVLAPENDGVFKVNIATGEKTLLVSFATMANLLREELPHIDAAGLFINHTLWSRTDERILIYVRGNWKPRPKGAIRINEFLTLYADGTHLTRHETFPGGHPEWGTNNTLIGAVDNRQIVYNVDSQQIVRTLGDRQIFPKPEGDIALSPDGTLLVNGYAQKMDNVYVVYNMQENTHFTTPGVNRGVHLTGDVRIDPAPCWRRGGKAIAVSGIADDRSRQTFVIEF